MKWFMSKSVSKRAFFPFCSIFFCQVSPYVSFICHRYQPQISAEKISHLETNEHRRTRVMLVLIYFFLIVLHVVDSYNLCWVVSELISFFLSHRSLSNSSPFKIQPMTLGLQEEFTQCPCSSMRTPLGGLRPILQDEIPYSRMRSHTVG